MCLIDSVELIQLAALYIYIHRLGRSYQVTNRVHVKTHQNPTITQLLDPFTMNTGNLQFSQEISCKQWRFLAHATEIADSIRYLQFTIEISDKRGDLQPMGWKFPWTIPEILDVSNFRTPYFSRTGFKLGESYVHFNRLDVGHPSMRSILQFFLLYDHGLSHSLYSLP